MLKPIATIAGLALSLCCAGSIANAGDAVQGGQFCTGATSADRAAMVFDYIDGEFGIRNSDTNRRGAQCGITTNNPPNFAPYQPSASVYIENWDTTNPMTCELKLRLSNGSVYASGAKTTNLWGGNISLATGAVPYGFWVGNGNLFIWCGIPGVVNNNRSGIVGWKTSY